MDKLLSGLESLGLGGLEGVNLYDKSKEVEKNKVKEPEKVSSTAAEKVFLFDKTYDCPVCDSKYTSKTVKSGRAKLLQTDLDLRSTYEGIDVVKYDTVVCPVCGYSVLARYFKNVTSAQAKLIKDNISQKVVLREYTGEIYTYEEALERYKLALACAVVKHAASSEKAYICLKSAWLLRGYRESLGSDISDGVPKPEELEEQEKAYLQNAYEGFVDARQKETPPIAGMDEVTVDYLLAVLAYRHMKYDVASRMISDILTSQMATSRMKDKARDLKEMVVEEMKRAKK
jgi:uncharacterized protein (DUF2225 family)